MSNSRGVVFNSAWSHYWFGFVQEEDLEEQEEEEAQEAAKEAAKEAERLKAIKAAHSRKKKKSEPVIQMPLVIHCWLLLQ